MYNQNLLNIGCEKSEILVEHVNVKNGRKTVFTYIDILQSLTKHAGDLNVPCFCNASTVGFYGLSFVQQSRGVWVRGPPSRSV